MSAAVLKRLIDDFTARRALRAGSFIVTFYGDVILPRGGSVWIGNVIETGRIVGINESQSRTAISRLVEDGRLIGLRSGRRSFYHLTEAAAAEFQAAAHAIHGPGRTPDDSPWTLVRVGPNAGALTALINRGFGAIGPNVALKPGDCGAEVRAILGADHGHVVFTAPPVPADPGALAQLAADTWDLAALSRVYAAFIQRFRPLTAALVSGETLSGAECLVARLLLVHEFRRIALSDPALPISALPGDWTGTPARAMFQDCYDRLTPAAERHVLSRFVDVSGLLRPLRAHPRVLQPGSDAA